MTTATTSREFFEQMYQRNADPWDFASSTYELERYRATAAALTHRRYRRAFEPGCSIGILTRHLATLCDQVEAMDIAPSAVSRARERCRNLKNVVVRCGALPEATPEGTFDLVVLSEIGYYFSEEQLRSVANSLMERLDRQGVFLAVHWLGRSDDHLLHGNCVHTILGSLDGLLHDRSELHTGFRLDRWTRI
jgi:2-polyprenyl-3-methyl-5-hydroxy-6-metoxy-1,4-benzoquinol methylase